MATDSQLPVWGNMWAKGYSQAPDSWTRLKIQSKKPLETWLWFPREASVSEGMHSLLPILTDAPRPVLHTCKNLDRTGMPPTWLHFSLGFFANTFHNNWRPIWVRISSCLDHTPRSDLGVTTKGLQRYEHSYFEFRQISMHGESVDEINKIQIHYRMCLNSLYIF